MQCMCVYCYIIHEVKEYSMAGTLGLGVVSMVVHAMHVCLSQYVCLLLSNV